ncbi:YhdT family protein [Robertmurraya sp. DFI.2.37]|uniref:YhdT family protein n=1 Tax=Robertmurraya sp. DFI.2.37 TaxID=3031819 RepID=UPI00124910F6|nr:YhdT family protein [Robertmurraya sp. DFI.2.37]MDF1509618.1 YhdT family protein [Robertmurraya sp. DFI.2.37]
MNKNKEDTDPRFKIANREAVIGIILVIINFVWWFVFAYGMGSGPIANYSYVMGLPAWFFYSCVGGFILMVLLVTAVVKFYFKEVSFEDEGRDDS